VVNTPALPLQLIFLEMSANLAAKSDFLQNTGDPDRCRLIVFTSRIHVLGGFNYLVTLAYNALAVSSEPIS